LGRTFCRGRGDALKDFKLLERYDLSKLCRVRTGGPATYYVEAQDINSLKEALIFAREKKKRFFIIGLGSNVLIDDAGFDGLVIRFKGDFSGHSFDENKMLISSGAGASLMTLGMELAKKNYEGYGYMAVIPGTVGAAVRINAGTTKEGAIKDHFAEADVLDPDTLEVKTIRAPEMSFGNRISVLANSRKIILGARFNLNGFKKRSEGIVEEDIKALLARRKDEQPKNIRNFGSTFKNPPADHTAGWYLEQSGMKGLRVGDAMVSEEHANWIVNLGHAKSENVKELIAAGQDRVYKQFHIRLEREVVFLPQDMEDWT
jgi:UDP-N-acetylmuramate dehydrogenase